MGQGGKWHPWNEAGAVRCKQGTLSLSACSNTSAAATGACSGAGGGADGGSEGGPWSTTVYVEATSISRAPGLVYRTVKMPAVTPGQTPMK